MSHTYGNVQGFKNFLIDDGQTDLASWTESDEVILGLLEGASRDVDRWTHRTRSGFGPRVGTNTYPWPDDCELDLKDDLLAITSFTAHDSNGDSGRTLTSGTDFYVPDVTPWTFLTLNAEGTATWGGAQRGNVIVGTWGYSNETSPLATAGTLTASATSIVLTGGTAYAGMTLLVESEQMYVTASGGTATVVRGVNGTTAAIHAANSAVSVYKYDRSVTRATYQLVGRDHRSFQSGITGDFGGGSLPIVGNRDTRFAILKSLQGLRRYV